MKRFKKGMFALCCLCAFVVVKADVAQAKALKDGKTYAIDLDGDGKKENIKCTTVAISDEKCAIRVYINGKRITTVMPKDYSFWGSASVIDIDKKDGKKELYVEFGVENDCFAGGTAYHYANGKLTKYFTFDAPTSFRMSIVESQPGNGTVYFIGEYGDDYVHQGYVKQAFKVSSGKLVPSSKTTLNTTSVWRKNDYKATSSFQVYDNIGDKSAKFTVAKGTIFHIYKIRVEKASSLSSGISYFYIRTSDGKEGWVKNPKKTFFIGRHAGNEEWDEWGFQWG